MVDNVTANAGSGGATFATDDDGTAHHPYTKMEWGADNTQTKVDTGSGALPVQGSAAENAAASANPVQVGGRYDATPRTLGDGDAGAIALDADGAVHISDGGNTLTVDGTVTANLSATDNAVLDQIELNTSYGDNTGGGTETGALRVTIANNSTGLLSVDDNGGSLTVDNAGTFATQVDGAALTALQLIDDVVATDASASPSTGNMICGHDGTNARRVAVDTAGQLQIDVVSSLPAGTNAIGKLSANSGVDIGDVDVTSISAGSNLIGDVGISGARTSGGTTLYKNIDVDESEDQVKGTAGQVYWIHAMNLSSAVKYLKLYNATAASVTVGTTTPDLTFPIPTQGDTNGAGFVLAIPNGIAFSTAITIAATTGVADADSGAPGANEVVVNLGYA